MLPAATVALHVVPVDLKTANEFVRRLHRHSRPGRTAQPVGDDLVGGKWRWIG